MRLYDFLSSGNGYKVRLLLTQLGHPVRADRDEHRRAGETRTPEFLAQEPERTHPGAGAGRRHVPCRVERDPLLPCRRHAVPAERRGWRARRCCSGCSSSSTATSRTSRGSLLAAPLRDGRASAGAAAAETRGRLRGARRHGAASGGARVLRRRALLASPTSRSTPTRTSPTRAASTSRRFPAVRAWLDRVRAEPRHIPITQG